MARFSQTAPYVGKGQKDLADRVASLAAIGEVVTERNQFHPHLFSRTHVRAAERAHDLTWINGDCSATLVRGHARRDAAGKWEQVTAHDGETGFCRLIDL